MKIVKLTPTGPSVYNLGSLKEFSKFLRENLDDIGSGYGLDNLSELSGHKYNLVMYVNDKFEDTHIYNPDASILYQSMKSSDWNNNKILGNAILVNEGLDKDGNMSVLDFDLEDWARVLRMCK